MTSSPRIMSDVALRARLLLPIHHATPGQPWGRQPPVLRALPALLRPGRRPRAPAGSTPGS